MYVYLFLDKNDLLFYRLRVSLVLCVSQLKFYICVRIYWTEFPAGPTSLNNDELYIKAHAEQTQPEITYNKNH